VLQNVEFKANSENKWKKADGKSREFQYFSRETEKKHGFISQDNWFPSNILAPPTSRIALQGTATLGVGAGLIVIRIVTDWFQIGYCECVYVGRVSPRAGLELVAFCSVVRLAGSPARSELSLLALN
jgi:hypothetical protein